MTAGDKIDFFVSYRSSEEGWATWLAWQLEEAGYTTFVQAWDFRPGGNFVAEMQKGTTKCARTLAVLSPTYFDSGFTKAEWYAAFANDPSGVNGLLLPVRVAECDVEGLLGQVIYVNLVGLDEVGARERLLAGVRRSRAKPSVAPSFPGATGSVHPKPGFPAPPANASDEAPPPPGDNHHLRLAVKLLKKVEGTPFFYALVDELEGVAAGGTVPGSSEQVVDCFSRCAPAEAEVLKLFYAVRRALRDAPSPQADLRLRRRCEEAAAALYCLAAACLVVRAAQAAGVQYVVRVPTSELIICAVIATALFGGEIRLKPPKREDKHKGLPATDYVFEVARSSTGEQPIHDFERAAYLALFENDQGATDISTYDGPLSETDREMLAARLGTYKNVDRASLCLVVRADFSEDAYKLFGALHQVPVMVPESAATRELLGMKVERLLAEIREFWAELNVMRGETGPSHPQPPSSQESGGATMSQSGPIIHIGTVSGGMAVSAGSHSPAQAGTGHTASVDHCEGADLAALTSLLQELAKEIAAHPSAEKRDELTAHVELAQHEAGKKEAADPNRIKRALDVIKSGADGLEQGGKILALCHKAYNVLAPLLNLPSSPLP
ncbi:MAG: TIR domain-containing protein [Rhodospirillales bacterium]|nr:TIR domain-containing protein [Rhodospirillales bacterium]